jgi:short-subunit dehydrogenase
MANTFKGQLAVVTGASSGIGYELAREFAEHGFDLVVAAEDGGIVEARQAFEGLGVKVESVQVDLARPEGVEKLWERVKALGRNVDAVAINAGVGVGGEFKGTDLDRELNIVDLNCRSVVHLAKRAVQQMTTQGHGRILITSSIASTMPGPFEAVYAASKAFDQSLAQALRHELKDSGITVTSLMPGATETNFFHRAGMDDTKVGTSKKDDAGEVA